MKKLIFVLIFNAVALFAFAQVTSVSYKIDKSTASSISFECKMVVNQGSATSFADRTQFSSQFVVKVPTGTTLQYDNSFMPLLDNATLSGTVPTEWEILNTAIAPMEQPESDFYLFAPDLDEEASYNELIVNDEVVLFSITAEEFCVFEVFPLDNVNDPVIIGGIDFSQKFSIGNANSVYLQNQLPLSFETEIEIYTEEKTVCLGDCVTIFPVLECAPNGLSFLWETGETTESIVVCPTEWTLYNLTINGPDGYSLDIPAEVLVQEEFIEYEDDGICIGDVVYFYPEIGSWDSSDENIAIINDEGELTAISVGTVTLFYTSDLGCMADVTVEIFPELIVSITGPTELCIGETTTAIPNVNTTWVSDDVNVLTIDNNGNITAVGAGLANVTCTDLTSDCSSTSEMITVHPDPFIQNLGSAELCIGEVTQLAGSAPGTWESEDVSIATISQNELVTAVGEGEVRFSLTDFDTGCVGYSQVVMVHGTPEVAITGSDDICIGQTTTLSPPTGGTWVSADDNIATVTSAGLVTGVGSGQTIFVFTDSTTGCSSDNTEPVFVGKDTDFDIIGPAFVCLGADITLSTSVDDAEVYIWTGPNGLVSSNQNLEIENFASEDQGEYFIDIITAAGCISSQEWFLELGANNCNDFISTECSTAEVICDIDILDGLEATMNFEDSDGLQPNPLCNGEGIANNISWIAFTAPSGDYEMLVNPYDCFSTTGEIPGVQMGVFSSCDFSDPIYCKPDCDINFANISSSMLIPGEDYYFFIDGCSNTVCRYEIDFIGSYISQCESPCEDTLTNNILGTAFIDDNGNGIFDSSEVPLRNVLVNIAPGDFSVLTDDNGNYSFEVEEGEYTLTANVNMGEWEQDELSISGIQISEPCNEGFNFGFLPISTPEETASLSVTNTIARCDFETKFRITIENTGDEPLEGVLLFEFDDEATFFSSEISGHQVDGNTVIANVGPLTPFTPETFVITLKMPSGSSNLPMLDFKATLFDKFGELIEEYEYSDQLRCSYDPNDKREYPDREGDDNLTLMDEDLEYTIRFQNNGNDTAFQVKIVDPLDPSIDVSTITVTSSSHDVLTCIDGTDLIFEFPNILLVDSTTNYEASQGYVTFRCQSVEGVAEMTPVHNQVDIIFDTNAPIVTNQTINTLVSVLCTDLFTFMEVTICEGDVYDGHTESGVYTDVFSLPFGCDSTVTLILEVQGITFAQENLLVCEGSSITINNEEYLIVENTTISDTTYSDEECISIVKTFNVEIISDLFDTSGEISICMGSDFSISPNLEGSWTSNDESIIVVDQNGNFTAVGVGSTTLTFTENQQGCTDDLSVSVFANPVIENTGSDQICISGITTLIADVGGFWSSDDESIATIDNNGTVTGIGEGTVNITFFDDVNGCGSSFAIDILSPTDALCLVSTDDKTFNNNVRLFPNPATTSIFIESTDKWEYITVMDTHGKTVKVLENISSGQTELNVSQLQSGLYLLIFKNGDQRESKRFVVNR